MKKKLRQEIITARLALSPAEVRAKSSAICQRLRPFWLRPEVRTVLLYLPFRQEVDMLPLFDELMAAGKRVAVPVCKPGHVLLPSEILDLSSDLQSGMWGILEPKPEAERPVAPEKLDCVIAPGVAFDRSFNRLGYGGGYYDRFLPRCRPEVPVLAPCYDLQLVDDVWAEPHDCSMTVLATENELLLNTDTEVGRVCAELAK